MVVSGDRTSFTLWNPGTTG